VLRTLALCCACLAAAPRSAAAEWHFTPMVGLTFRGNTSLVDNEFATDKLHKHFGGAVSRLGEGVLGVEGVFVSTPGFFRGDGRCPEAITVCPSVDRVKLVETSRSFALMGNGVLTVPRRWTEYSLRPFVSGGLGLMHASESDPLGFFSVRSNLAGFNIGGGAVGFLSARTGVRFDLRYYSTLHRVEQGPVSIGRVHLSYMTASVGVVIRR
jgi:hypothetical protein